MIRDYGYTHSEAEFEEMRELLVKSYAVSRKPLNWRLALIENWNYASRYLEPPEYFTDNVHLWRNDAGELVSFLVHYYDTTYLQVLPEYRFLESAMLEWAEYYWAENGGIETIAFDYDTERQQLLEKRGYTREEVAAYMRVYDLKKMYAEPVLPPGFHIATLADVGNYADRIALENAIWDADLDEKWFNGKSSAPTYSFDWDLVVVSPEGQQVASCLVWIYSENKTAEIDPLGTHPDYRGRGLAKALVTESFRRMRACSIDYVYIASAHNNDIVNCLYASLQPIETYRVDRWVYHTE